MFDVTIVSNEPTIYSYVYKVRKCPSDNVMDTPSPCDILGGILYN